jgi:hypothetical protein|tara:strand:- start:290 stop:430 length:141 start_codon:yes stop_codon:yes gene_type:complete
MALGKKKVKADSLDEQIKLLDVAAQTPFEKGKRRKRIQQSRQNKVS